MMIARHFYRADGELGALHENIGFSMSCSVPLPSLSLRLSYASASISIRSCQIKRSGCVVANDHRPHLLLLVSLAL